MRSRVGDRPATARRGLHVGFDLGYNESMSAVVAYWPGTLRFEMWVAFPEIPDLVTRGRADGIGGLYVQMAERGELRLRE